VWLFTIQHTTTDSFFLIMAKIVVLEDDTATRRLICAVLKKSGHEVLDVDNGAEGLLTVMAEQPDLVISDVEMPKMTGFEVLQNVRLEPETADTCFILLTSLSSRADMRKGMAQGADDYITKPFEPAELMDSVNAQLGRLATRRGQTVPTATNDFESTAPAPLAFKPLPNLQREPAAPAPRVAHAPPPAEELPRQHIDKAWAVNLSVQNHEEMQKALPVKEWRLLLRQLFIPVSKNAVLRTADYLDLQGGNLILYFVDRGRPNTAHDVEGPTRAAHVVEAMVRAAADCKRWAAMQFKALNAPPARLVVSLHTGPIEVVEVPMDFGGERSTVVGATADYITRLRDGEPRVMWRVLITAPALKESAGFYKLGASMDVSVGTQEHAVHALQGLAPELSQADLHVQAADWI
jgi:DNA-binding response OmpR family regulator